MASSNLSGEVDLNPLPRRSLSPVSCCVGMMSERKWFKQPEVWPATCLTWGFPHFLGCREGGMGCQTEQGPRFYLSGYTKPLLHSTIIRLSHAEVRLGWLSPLTLSQRNQCLIAVLDSSLILLKLKLRVYLPLSQDPYSSWQRSGSDVWDIK